VSGVAERLELIRARVSAAAERAGRDPESVRLLAVSKGQPSELLREAYAAGQRDFGENYAQELAKKAEELADLPELRLHMIGHLQRNKAKVVVRHAASVHSVDSVALALELDKRVPEGKTLEVLVEVSIAGEAQKSGVDPDELGVLLERIDSCPRLSAVGLMCVPPESADPELARPFFRKLRELRDRHGGSARLPELSMGMSADFEIAIAEGSTMVRVGTAIFGPRRPRGEAEP
jgi:pyridoxal phosphate enzyme (YggS family)